MNTKDDPKSIIAHNRVVYDAIATHFSATREYTWSDLLPLAEYTKDGDSVLDLGCGNGRLYQMFAKKQVQYTGVDQSQELLKIAHEKFPTAKFVVGEMSKLDFAGETFDSIYCIAALNHIPGREFQLQCVKEMYRVLKPGGKLLMTNWNLFSQTAQAKAREHGWVIEPDSDDLGIDIMVPWKDSSGKILGERYYHGFTAEELQELCMTAGFTCVDQYYSRKGEHVSIHEGGNLVSILKK
jgi:ubiquinone/menaquinone biosynthesis C-methylase UbiE